jgi:hypothetical protein
MHGKVLPHETRQTMLIKLLFFHHGKSQALTVCQTDVFFHYRKNQAPTSCQPVSYHHRDNQALTVRQSDVQPRPKEAGTPSSPNSCSTTTERSRHSQFAKVMFYNHRKQALPVRLTDVIPPQKEASTPQFAKVMFHYHRKKQALTVRQGDVLWVKNITLIGGGRGVLRIGRKNTERRRHSQFANMRHCPPPARLPQGWSQLHAGH